MLPGAPKATIDNSLTLSGSAREALLGRFPQLSESIIKAEVSSLLASISSLQLAIVTQRLDVQENSIMDSQLHNDYLLRLRVDLITLYNRIRDLQGLVGKVQLLSTVGLNDIKIKLSNIEDTIQQLIAVQSLSGLIGALILTEPLELNGVGIALSNGAVVPAYTETTFNDRSSIKGVVLTFPATIHSRELLGIDPEKDYATGSYSCFIKGMGNGMWYENIYCEQPEPDGLEYTITVTFRSIVTINGLLLSIVDRTSNRIVKVECWEDSSDPSITPGWQVAKLGSLYYDRLRGWQANTNDPADIMLDPKAVSKLRITIRNYQFDYVSVDEMVQTHYAPKTVSEMMKGLPTTKTTKYARYKVGTYYIAPHYRQTKDGASLFASKIFKPSYLSNDKSFYANNLAVFTNSYIRRDKAQDIKADLVFKYDTALSNGATTITMRDVPIGLPGIMFYDYNTSPTVNIPQTKTDYIDTTTTEQLSTSWVLPTTAPYINYNKWMNPVSATWYYVDAAGLPSPKSFDVDNRSLEKLATTDQRALPGHYTWGIPEAAASTTNQNSVISTNTDISHLLWVDTDLTYTIQFNYNTPTDVLLKYRFSGNDKTTGLEVTEEAELVMLGRTTSAESAAFGPTTINLRTKNAIGTIILFCSAGN